MITETTRAPPGKDILNYAKEMIDSNTAIMRDVAKYRIYHYDLIGIGIPLKVAYRRTGRLRLFSEMEEILKTIGVIDKP